VVYIETEWAAFISHVETTTSRTIKIYEAIQKIIRHHHKSIKV
jgi:hypothetical protein